MVKHDTDWTVTRHSDGSYTWTSPTGRHHHVDPTVHPIDHTLDNQQASDDDLPRAG